MCIHDAIAESYIMPCLNRKDAAWKQNPLWNHQSHIQTKSFEVLSDFIWVDLLLEPQYIRKMVTGFGFEKNWPERFGGVNDQKFDWISGNQAWM